MQTWELGGIALAIYYRSIGLKTVYNHFGVAAIPQPLISPSHFEGHPTPYCCFFDTYWIIV
jgi:hypothetical protein